VTEVPDPPAGSGERWLAVDVGGTKLDVGVVDGSGAVLARRRTPTPPAAEGGAAALADALVDLCRAVVDEAGPVAAVGVGCGGPMEGDLVSPLNIPVWRQFPLRDRLAGALGLPVAVDNDAKALALGEGWLGAAVGVADYLAMVVSTGVGGGIVLDGRLLDGALGNAGHIGHIIVEPGGAECGCGARGCLEAECSGLHLGRRLGRPAAEAPPEVVARTGRLVGRGVASVCNLLDLRLALVAGSVALGFGDPFFAAAQAELDACARLAFSAGAVVRPGGLGPDGPLLGAAAVARRMAA
jgi:glucokinase